MVPFCTVSPHSARGDLREQQVGHRAEPIVLVSVFIDQKHRIPLRHLDLPPFLVPGSPLVRMPLHR
jgi:hypothetical protein